MSIWDRIRSRIHKPFVETVFEGYPAYVKRFRWALMMWVEKEDGLHKYRNGVPSHPFGGKPMVYAKCSWKWLARLAQIKADMDGYWRPDRTWDGTAQAYLHGRKVSDRARYYLDQVACDVP